MFSTEHRFTGPSLPLWSILLLRITFFSFTLFHISDLDSGFLSFVCIAWSWSWGVSGNMGWKEGGVLG